MRSTWLHRSLYDPGRSALHKSINRIGKKIQEVRPGVILHTLSISCTSRHACPTCLIAVPHQAVDIFHVETVVDDNIFPWYLSWVLVLKRDMALWQRALMHATVLSLPLLPLPLRKWIFWSPLTWGPYGLVQVHAGETTAVHERTLAANYAYVVCFVVGVQKTTHAAGTRW